MIALDDNLCSQLFGGYSGSFLHMACAMLVVRKRMSGRADLTQGEQPPG